MEQDLNSLHQNWHEKNSELLSVKAESQNIDQQLKSQWVNPPSNGCFFCYMCGVTVHGEVFLLHANLHSTLHSLGAREDVLGDELRQIEAEIYSHY